jgi:uncharacterized paraquat-inducible protein A
MTFLRNLLAYAFGRRHLSWCAICAYHEYQWRNRCPRCGSRMTVDKLCGR